jgi:hypothetical protein
MPVIRAIAILLTVVLGVALPARAQVLYGAGHRRRTVIPR